MTVEVTPSKAYAEDHPYGDGKATERGVEEATTVITFDDWNDVVKQLAEWAAGERFSNVFCIVYEGPADEPLVLWNNIEFAMKGKNV